jgi:type II restriction enzyme
MALAFLAVSDMKPGNSWKYVPDSTGSRSMRTRDVIEYVNRAFGENISSGSYDDIRRKDLILLTLAGIVITTNLKSSRNDPSRGYALSPEYAEVIREFGSGSWNQAVSQILQKRGTLQERLSLQRAILRKVVTIEKDVQLSFGPGEHNELIKAVVEEFLPRFGNNAAVLYVGDAENRLLYINRQKLSELDFFDLSHGELPDVVAYSEEKGWLFLVEAVYSSGSIGPLRKLRLQGLTASTKAAIVYVTAFQDRASLRKFLADIAWETEVWIADDPDHLIHFDGEKFLGPY